MKSKYYLQVFSEPRAVAPKKVVAKRKREASGGSSSGGSSSDGSVENDFGPTLFSFFAVTKTLKVPIGTAFVADLKPSDIEAFVSNNRQVFKDRAVDLALCYFGLQERVLPPLHETCFGFVLTSLGTLGRQVWGQGGPLSLLTQDGEGWVM